MAAWSTVAQVLTLTAATVTEDELTRAEAVVALAVGRDPATTPADYTVASLRKLLSVPDGAFVTGLRAPVALANAVPQADPQVIAAVSVTSEDPALGGSLTH